MNSKRRYISSSIDLNSVTEEIIIILVNRDNTRYKYYPSHSNI